MGDLHVFDFIVPEMQQFIHQLIYLKFLCYALVLSHF
jgi:hypothetical protein